MVDHEKEKRLDIKRINVRNVSCLQSQQFKSTKESSIHQPPYEFDKETNVDSSRAFIFPSCAIFSNIQNISKSYGLIGSTIIILSTSQVAGRD